MFKIKSLGIVALCALSFTFMSFSSSSDDLYSANYSSNIENAQASEIEDAAFVAALGRLAVAASRRAVVYTREVARVALPAIEETVVQASTVVAFANNVEKHSKDYAKVIEILKDQQIRKLG